ncbi:hypothetical protein CY34DRAFT_803168 [Suillus luteus UH-Slu-Lm8-n1]|uniref:Uncharacterized protein n=1 Tax=Suillus luteus UH-Slu-Lm8-n1 TaxID=930992 RepID=A0A0D0BCQ6_9AGAM|nr:hypothetical protein CY34DRAFT_803168 [Suillus luteus UH-Slu-Lm8-n1]
MNKVYLGRVQREYVRLTKYCWTSAMHSVSENGFFRSHPHESRTYERLPALTSGTREVWCFYFWLMDATGWVHVISMRAPIESVKRIACIFIKRLKPEGHDVHRER